MVRGTDAGDCPQISREGTRPSVLIIDDDEAVLNYLAAAIGNLGYRITTARDGFKGLAEFRRSHPRIVLADLLMPNMDGIEIIRKIRHERADTLIIAMSGGGKVVKTHYLTAAQKLGANARLEKPFSAAVFHDVATSLLRHGRAPVVIPSWIIG